MWHKHSLNEWIQIFSFLQEAVEANSISSKIPLQGDFFQSNSFIKKTIALVSVYIGWKCEWLILSYIQI